MKQVLSLLLCAAICLSFSACKKKESENTTAGESTTREPEIVQTSDKTVSKTPIRTTTSERVPQTKPSTSQTTKAADTSVTRPTYAPDDPTPRPVESDRVLFSSFWLTAYLRTAEIVPSYNGGYPRLTFYLTNSSGQNFDVRITVRAINRYAVEYGDSVFLLSKTAAVLPITCNENIDGQLEEAIVEITVKNESKIELYHSYITVDLRQSEE